MIREILADIFLGLAVATVLASAVGVLMMDDVYQTLHFVTPAALVAPVLVTLAVFVHAGFSATTTQALIVLLFMAVAGPFLSHATIRAARIREKGDWRPGRGGRDTGAAGLAAHEGQRSG